MKLKDRLVRNIMVAMLFIGVVGGSLLFYFTDRYFEKKAIEETVSEMEQSISLLQMFLFERIGDMNNFVARLKTGNLRTLKEMAVDLIQIRNTYGYYLKLDLYDAVTSEKLVDTDQMGIGKISEDVIIPPRERSGRWNMRWVTVPEMNFPSLIIFGRFEAGGREYVLSSHVNISNLLDRTESRLLRQMIGLGESPGVSLAMYDMPTHSFLHADGSFSPAKLKSIQEKKLFTNRIGRIFWFHDSEEYYFTSEIDPDFDKVPELSLYMSKTNAVIFGPSYRTVGAIILFWVVFALGLGFYLYAQVKSVLNPLSLITKDLELLGNNKFAALPSRIAATDEISILHNTIVSVSEQLEKSILELGRNSRLSAIGQMAGGIAHEINNPLSIIIGRVKRISRKIDSGQVDAAFFKKELADILGTVDKITATVRNMRALSGDGAAENMVSANLAGIVTSVLEVCRGRLYHQAIDLRFVNNAVDREVFCRPVQISQIVLNLISNATDAIEQQPGDRWIEIKLEVHNSSVYIRVSNSGPKISAEVSEKLFQPFFTTKDSTKGTGLGLSICRKIAESHNGTINLDSHSSNTTFVLSLPEVVEPVNFN